MSDYLYKIYPGTRKIHRPINYQKHYTCKQCPFRAPSLANLTHHAKLTHTNREPLDPFQCSGNPPEPYRCYYCDLKTDLKVEYNEHIEKTKHENPSDKLKKPIPNQVCVKCKFKTHSRLVMFKHVSSACLVDGEKAELLLASLQDKIPENQVEVLHYDPKTQQASSVCSVRWEVPEQVAPEQPSQMAKKKVKCDQCGLQLDSSTTLKVHVLLMHTLPEAVERIKCPECPFVAKERSRFIRHIKAKHAHEDDVKIYKCSLCSFRNKKQHKVRKHCKLVHAEGAEAEWFQCKFCPHKTKWRQHLTRHEKAQHHADCRKFQCELCPYWGRQKTQLKLHVVHNHTPDAEVEWFRCNECDYKAKLKGGLKLHRLKKHASSDEVDWFVCDKCGFKALERGAFNRHMKKKH